MGDLTDGVHFNVPGGESVTDYEADLLAVFRQIADDRSPVPCSSAGAFCCGWAPRLDRLSPYRRNC